MSESIIDAILDLKQKCHIEEEIGATYDLTPRQISCILALRSDESVSASDLSSRLGLSLSRGSRVISALQKKGYLEVVHDKSDRRYVMISLTRSGINCLRSVEREKRICEERLLKQFDPDQAAEIARHLSALVAVL